MTEYLVLKFVHIVGACVLLGTGAGIAFFMLMAHLKKDVAGIAAVSRIVVIADFVFTATAALIQPISGVLLVRAAGYSLAEGWIVVSIILYIVVGAFWLPVVWIQKQMSDLARQAAVAGNELPPRYYKLFRVWFWFGWPAFASVIAIIWLMIARPEINLGAMFERGADVIDLNRADGVGAPATHKNPAPLFRAAGARDRCGRERHVARRAETPA
jgi:uncharacterized membrane protein